ncbi:MAG: hypothetical protein HC828_02140 [Blastochloris sp.]|nr:hypothetical protein [Blastochloris sp.]
MPQRWVCHPALHPTPPMNDLTPQRLAAGEDYASLDELLACDDRVECTVRVPHWKRKGQAMALRVRGLSLEQQDTIRMQAGRKVPAGDRAIGVRQHWPTFVTATIREGVTAPAMTAEQAAAFAHKNPRACELLSDFIWLISGIDQREIESIVTDLAEEDALKVEAQDAQPDAARDVDAQSSVAE